MFENAGRKLSKMTCFFFVLKSIINAILGIVSMVVLKDYMYFFGNSKKALYYLGVILLVIIIILFDYLICLLILSFTQLSDNSNKIYDFLTEEKKSNVAAPKETIVYEDTKFCRYCGAKIPADSSECPTCNAKL